jgi:Domain of unknown function (DUF4838)
VYGVYALLERYMGCSKLAGEPASVPANSTVKIPNSVRLLTEPPFIYRQAYYPASNDAEYLEWHGLHQFEDLWGLWGHSYDKLVPAKQYFAAHPEYYALVRGKRDPVQLCLSNEDVFNIVVAELKKRMARNPDAIYWSVSQNDAPEYCHCAKCAAADAAEGGPQGSLIRFVNRVAARFPDKIITTLAYSYTHKPTKNLRPADNVYIMLSDIDAYRDKPLSEEKTAATFRSDLDGWHAKTENIFVWDYLTEFTNYLAPFPNLQTLQPNMQYLKEHGVKGVFEQGSGDTYSELAELRNYILTRLLWDPKAPIKEVTSSFLQQYYGAAAKYVQQYIDAVQEQMTTTHRHLDIYGNPVNEWNSYLTPELLDMYSSLLDKAEVAAESNPTLADRVTRLRLPVEYTVLQQARFYGIEKFGIFEKDNNGNWQVRQKLKDKVTRFVANCKKAGVTELSEGGNTPDQYQAEWNAIYNAGVKPTLALGAKVSLGYPFVEDWPAKGNRTLVDGTPGYNDFSYNWLLFYGTPMIANLELPQPVSVRSVEVHFLDDPRHWIFPPQKITIEVSEDGSRYRTIGNADIHPEDEHYDVQYSKTLMNNNSSKVKFIKVTAIPPPTLPEWRWHETKKPMIACDEIYVQ